MKIKSTHVGFSLFWALFVLNIAIFIFRPMGDIYEKFQGNGALDKG